MTTDRYSGYLNSDDAKAKIARAVEAWASISSFTTWEQWLVIGEAIALAQEEARTYANGQNTGRRYTEFLTHAYSEGGQLAGLRGIDKGTRSKAAECWHKAAEISAWMLSLDSGGKRDKRLRLNHPDAVLKAYAKSLPESQRPGAERRETQRQANVSLQEKLDAALATIDRMVREEDGHQYGWSDDSTAPEVARSIYEGVKQDRRRWNRVRDAVEALFVARTGEPAPARGTRRRGRPAEVTDVEEVETPE